MLSGRNLTIIMRLHSRRGAKYQLSCSFLECWQATSYPYFKHCKGLCDKELEFNLVLLTRLQA